MDTNSTAMHLRRLLTNGLKISDLVTVERTVTLPEVVTSGLPIIKQLPEKEVAATVTVAMGRFMNLCFPNQAKEDLIIEFAEEVIRNRFTWNAADVVMFFKFVKERQDIPQLKIMGNVLTYFKLMEMLVIYEDYRAQEIEQMHLKKKGEITAQNKTIDQVNGKILQKFASKEPELKDLGLGKSYEQAAAERERTGKDVSYRKEIPDSKFFDKINSGK